MSQRRTKRKGLATFCPACGSDIHFRRLPRRGSTVTCRECQSFLEVRRLAPLTLEWAFEEPLSDDELDRNPYADYRDRHGFEAYAEIPEDSLVHIRLV